MQELRDELTGLKESVASMSTALGEVHTAIVGNEKLGHKGLAARVGDNEKKLVAHEQMFIRYAAYAVAGSMTVGFMLKLLGLL